MTEILQPGPALDMRIATAFFGWDQIENAEQLVLVPDGARKLVMHVPFFSTKMGASWFIVEELQRRGKRVSIIAMEDRWMAGCERYDGICLLPEVGLVDGHLEPCVVATTPSLALCALALTVCDAHEA